MSSKSRSPSSKISRELNVQAILIAEMVTFMVDSFEKCSRIRSWEVELIDLDRILLNN